MTEYLSESRAALLACLLDSLKSLEKTKANIFELRPRTKSMPEALSGDYDYVIDPCDTTKIIKHFLSACTNHKVHLEFISTDANKRIIKLIQNGNHITVELWLNIELAGPAGPKDPRQISGAEICRLLNTQDNNKAETIKAALYLTHLYYKGKNLEAPLQQHRLAYFQDILSSKKERYNKDCSGPQKKIKDMYDMIMQCSEADIAEANREALSFLKKQGLSSTRIKRPMLRTLNLDRHLISHVVPFMGPDGSGKTYVVNKLVHDEPHYLSHLPYKKMFRNKDYTFLIRVLKKIYKRDSQNQLDERASGYVVIKSSVVCVLWSLLHKRHRKLLIVDRYAWDFVLKGIRLKDRAARRIWMHGIFIRMIPRPRKCIIMVAQNETIQSRKNELSNEQIAFVYDQYINNVANARCRRAFFCCSENEYEHLQFDLKSFVMK